MARRCGEDSDRTFTHSSPLEPVFHPIVFPTDRPPRLPPQVKIAGQRYLLSPGDHFFVPQATMYSMVNHSPSTPAEVAFVVIKAASMVSAAYEGGGGGDAAAAAAGGGSPIPPQPRLNSPSAYEGGGEGARAPRGSANRGREVAGDDGS